MSLIGFTMLTLGDLPVETRKPPAPKGPSKAFTCPRCGAKPGQKCKAPTGRACRSHGERLALVAEVAR